MLRTVRRPFLLTAACLVSGLAGCGGGVDTEHIEPVAAECVLMPTPAEGPDTIRFALVDDAAAAELTVARQLYETLVRVDCRGVVHPALAESWESGGGGRRWAFMLREGARFWNGGAVTAEDVAASWAGYLAGDGRVAGIDSVVVRDKRTLEVYVEEYRGDAPRMIAEAEFAVRGPRTESSWLAGSGAYQVAAVGTSNSLLLEPAFDGDRPVVQMRFVSATGARDVLERGVDVMVTREPSVIDYAASKPELEQVALPWDRLYLLLSTSRVQELRSGARVSALSRDFREALARDAVRGEARGYAAPGWWEDLRGCGELSRVLPGLPPVPRGAYAASGARRVLFHDDDPVAADLAGRIVAIAAADPALSSEAARLAAAVPGLAGTDGRAVAQGMTSGELGGSLREGDDLAYVISVPAHPLDLCFEARKLVRRVQWLGAEGMELREAFVPLVETRKRMIARRAVVGLVVDAEGTVLISSDATKESRRP